MAVAILMLLTATFWALFHVGSKMAGAGLHPMLATSLSGFVCFVAGLGGFCFFRSGGPPCAVTARGVVAALAMGVMAFLGDTLYVALYRERQELSTVGPTVLVLLNLFVFALGVTVLKETVSAGKLVGVTLGAIAVYLISGR